MLKKFFTLLKELIEGFRRSKFRDDSYIDEIEKCIRDILGVIRANNFDIQGDVDAKIYALIQHFEEYKDDYSNVKIKPEDYESIFRILKAVQQLREDSKTMTDV